MGNTVAILRDGSTLKIGDEVTSTFKGCAGYTFIVCEINPYEHCESHTRVVVHLKGDESRKILGFKKEGHPLNGPDGIDANWFKKVAHEPK